MSPELQAAITEHSEAITEHIAAQKTEVEAKQIKEKARYRLLQARDTLRAIERELLEI